ncbi:DUF7224 domain-containing protein [Cellulomonas hominis]
MNGLVRHPRLAVRTTWVVPMTALAVVVEVVGILGRGRDWVGVWPQATVVVMWPSMFVAAIVTATACLDSQARVRSTSEPIIGGAARPRWRLEMAAIAPAVAVGVLALLAGGVTVTVMSWSHRGPGWLWPGYLIAPFALVLLASAAGHLVGLLAPTPWVVPVVAAAVFGVAVTLPVFLVLDGDVQLRPSTPAALSVAAAGMGAVATAVLLPAEVHHGALRVPVRRGVAVVGAGVVVGLLAVSVAVPVQQQRTPPAAALCAGMDPQVCLWPDSRRWLTDAEEIAATIGAQAVGVGLAVPERIDELGLPGASPESSRTLTTGMGRWGIADSVAFAVLDTADPGCAPAEGQEETYYTAWFSLLYWLTVTGAGGPMPVGVHNSFEDLIDRPHIEALVISDPADQVAWATAQLDVLAVGC